MRLAIVAVLIAVAIFVAGVFVGGRMSGGTPDAVTNSMLQEKIDHETATLSEKIDRIDSKIDVLLNIATNAVRDFRR